MAKATPLKYRRPAPPSVLHVYDDGSYDWKCLGCGKVFPRYPAHRGRRRTLCRPCQNVRTYRKRKPDAQRRGKRTAAYKGTVQLDLFATERAD